MPVFAMAAALAAAVPTAPAPIGGRWLTVDGAAVVEVSPCRPAAAAVFCGRVVRVVKPRPGGPAVDVKNPDPALRTRPIQGIAILSGFTADRDRWRGHIYDPESGRTYRSELTTTGRVLHVKGCVGPFCRTQDWTRTG